MSGAPGAPDLLAVIEQRAACPFLIDATDGWALSYGEAHERACRLAGALLERGLEPGDRVIVSLPNGPELALVYLAAMYAGFSVVPVALGFGLRELRSILARSRARSILRAQGDSSRLPELARQAGIADITVGVAGAAGQLDAREPSAPAVTPFAHWTPDEVVAIHFTSGTTGAPRGIGHRLGDFLGNAQRLARATGADPDLRFYAMLPMTYLGGYYNLLLLPLALGASVVVDRAFDGRMALDFWATPARHSVSALWFVPTIMAMLMRMDRGERGRHHCREQVRFAAVGMGPLSAELREEFDSAYGLSVLENYGLAETLLAVSASPERPPPPGSSGTALDDVRLRVVDGDGNELPTGSEGLIEIATPDMMVGYLDDGGAGFDPGLRAGGWLNTGDLGVIEGDGHLRITGRVKEVIIRGGVNVSALAVEEALAGHPGLRRLAVIGLPHPVLGEEIAAVVMCETDVALEDIEPDLRETARQRLDASQQPDVYVQIDELPLTPSGKVRSQALREMVIEHLGLAAARG